MITFSFKPSKRKGSFQCQGSLFVGTKHNLEHFTSFLYKWRDQEHKVIWEDDRDVSLDSGMHPHTHRLRNCNNKY